jgi:hypothetical protein
MPTQKIPFSQHFTLIVLFCALLGMGCWMYKLKKITPKIKDVNSEIRDAQKAKKFLTGQQRAAENEDSNPKKAQKKLDKIEEEKKKFEEQLAGLLSTNLKENDFAAVQQILLEIVSSAKNEGLEVFKHESLDIKSNKKHLYVLSFTCTFEQLTPFIEKLTKLSSPVILDKLKIDNLGETLNIQLEYSL